MPCIVALTAFFFPRLAIILLVILSDYIGRAYQNDVWAFLGFFIAPLTTLAYAWGINSNGRIDGIYLVVLVIAVLMDMGIIGGGARASQVRRSRVVIARRD